MTETRPSRPEVSVVIPTFNYGQFLGQAIQSVLEQTVQDFELIVVDDGSTDDTREVVARFESDRRVRYVFQDNRGGGAATARNAGIAMARGRYLAFLDSDDHWLPEKLARQLAVLRTTPGAVAVHSAVYEELVDDEQRVVSRRILRRGPLREKSVYEQLLYKNAITGSASSVLLSKDVLADVGLFDEDVVVSDWDLWLRIARHHSFHYLDAPLACVRRHGSNQSVDLDLMADGVERMLTKLDRDVPEEFRYHLPRVQVRLSVWLAWEFARRRRWLSSWRYASRAAAQAIHCPLFTARFLVTAPGGRLRRRLAERPECRPSVSAGPARGSARRAG